jgi:hypothetical protein
MVSHRFARGLLLGAGCAGMTVLAGCGSGSSSSVAPSPPVTQIASSAQIWFHPQPLDVSPRPGEPNGVGAADFLELFAPNAPWVRVAGHTRVLGLYAGWIATVSNEVLQETVEFINAHNMQIEIEAPALQATASCGSGVEGYVPFGQSLHDFTLVYLQRLKAFGAQAPFIKVDEPYYFGSVVTDPSACQWPVSQVAADVGAYVQLVRTVYPNAVVGDVEPIITRDYSPDVLTAIAQWHGTYQALTGAPFPFFFADIDFSNGNWPALVKTFEAATRQAGMRFGIIYIGDPQDVSDAEWAGKVVARFELYQGENGGRPDYVLFQSWEPHPQYCLPESDPNTFTGVIDAYINATTGNSI